MKKKCNHASWKGESRTPLIYKGNTPLFTIQAEKEVGIRVIRHEKNHYYPKTTTTITTKADTVNTYKLVVTYYFYTFTGEFITFPLLASVKQCMTTASLTLHPEHIVHDEVFCIMENMIKKMEIGLLLLFATYYFPYH